MTDDDLAVRLADLGRALELDRDLRESVLEALGTSPPRRGRRLVSLVAAVAALAVTVAVVVPSSRQTLARWFGLDGVEVRVDPDASIPALPAVPPEGSRVHDVDGRRVVVTGVGGHFDDLTISKTVGASDQVREVAVGDRPGLWFPVPHTVLYVDGDGRAMSTGVAAATLLVDTGDGIVRIEGFDELDDAVAFVEEIGLAGT